VQVYLAQCLQSDVAAYDARVGMYVSSLALPSPGANVESLFKKLVLLRFMLLGFMISA
jgi:hypothetical protein